MENNYTYDFLLKDELVYLQTQTELTPRQIKIIDVILSWKPLKTGKNKGYIPVTIEQIIEGLEEDLDRKTIGRDLRIMEVKGYISRVQVKVVGVQYKVNAFKVDVIDNFKMSHSISNSISNSNTISNTISNSNSISILNDSDIISIPIPSYSTPENITEEKNNIDIYGYCLKQLYLYEGFTESRDFNQFKKDISQYGIKKFIENLETSTMPYDNIEKLQDIIKTSKEEYNLNLALNNN